MKKFVLFAVLLFVTTVTAGGVSIPPGGTVTLTNMPANGGVLGSNGNITFSLLSLYDLDAKRIRALSRGFGASIGTGTASSQIFYDFEVGSTPETVGHTVGAWINYLALWEGSQTILAVGVSNSSVDVDLVLRDLTEARNLHFEPIHELDLKTFRVKYVLAGIDFDDSASKVSTFPAVLKRGHTYRLTLRMSTSVFLLAPLASGSIVESNYFGNGVRLSLLNVKVGLDEREVLNRLDSFLNHRHIYLTGRGEGHNNTEAASSLPVAEKKQSDESGPPVMDEPKSDPDEKPRLR
ncbi:MAG: hypothetical protein ABI857_12865 [Acidobacteriota bacterium]